MTQTRTCRRGGGRWWRVCEFGVRGIHESMEAMESVESMDSMESVESMESMEFMDSAHDNSRETC